MKQENKNFTIEKNDSLSLQQDLPKKTLQKTWAIALLATFSCFLWGSAFPSLKISYELLNIGSSPWAVKMQFAGYRFFLAALLIFAYMAITKMTIKPTKEELKPMLILGIFQTTIQYIFFYIGIGNTTGVIGSILTATGTFFSLILPHFYYKDDKLNTIKTLGLIIGFSGIVFMNFGKGGFEGHFKLLGEGILIISSLTGAAASIYAKENSSQINPVKLNAYQMLFGSLIMIIASIPLAGGNAIHFSLESFPIFLWLSFISGAAYTLWYMLLKHNKVSQVSIYKFQVPIWGSILSALLVAGESITLMTVFSLALTVVGIILVNLNFKTNHKSH